MASTLDAAQRYCRDAQSSSTMAQGDGCAGPFHHTPRPLGTCRAGTPANPARLWRYCCYSCGAGASETAQRKARGAWEPR